MNRYESVILDKMVELRKEENDLASGVHGNDVAVEMSLIGAEIMLLLDCIVDFRNPPVSLAVEDGCGAMVGKVDE